MHQSFEIEVEGKSIRITNPEKLLWPDIEISKMDYIRYLVDMSPYILPYVQNRLLTTIRYPDGIHGKSFYQKNIPDHAPEWIQTHHWRETEYIVLHDLPTLVWLGNQACLEFHVSFNFFQRESYPTELVFDLDPTDVDNFALVLEVSLKIKEVIDSLGLYSQPKTSGASGLQIYIPIEARYTYEETHLFNKFIAQYVAEKSPKEVTLERLVKNRGKKLYFDYIQHGEGRTLPAPYSTRAREAGSVSTPVSWDEIGRGFLPTDFSMLTIGHRMEQKGDLFAPITTARRNQSLDHLLDFLRGKVT